MTLFFLLKFQSHHFKLYYCEYKKIRVLRILSTTFFLLITILGMANQSKIDSLINADDSLKITNNSRERFLVHSQLAKQYKAIHDTDRYIGSILTMANMSRASGSHLISLNILQELENSIYTLTPKEVIQVCLIKGSTLYEIDDKDSAIYWAHSGLLLSKKFGIQKFAPLLNNLLGASFMFTKPDSAISYIETSIAGFLSVNDSNGVVLPYLNLALLYGNQNRYSKAIETIANSLVILDQEDVPIYRKMAYANLAMIYRDIEDYKNSTLFLNLRDSVNYEINNNQLIFQFSQFQDRLEDEKNTRELMKLKAKVEIAEVENRNQDILITLGLVLLVALGMSLFFAIKSSRDRKKMTQIMHNKAQELEQINRFKNQILSVISHDMRSPLAQVITFQHAKNSGINFSPDEIREMDKTIMASAKNGLLILDNLLKWANNQFSSEELKLETFDSYFVITQIIQQVDELANEKDIVIHSDVTTLDLFTNESLYQIILRNLLSNAIKFSPMNSEIRVNARLEENNFIITVTDQGPGIPKRILDALDKGDRIKPKTGSYGEKGAGIGLTFSKEFAQRIGATLTFNTEILVGTEATFTLPIAKEAPQE